MTFGHQRGKPELGRPPDLYPFDFFAVDFAYIKYYKLDFNMF